MIGQEKEYKGQTYDGADVHFYRGNQTPRALIKTQLINPLHFWFCKDVSQSFPIASTPHGLRYIVEITLEKLKNIVQEYPYVYINQIKFENGLKRNTRMYFNPGKLIGNINMFLYINNLFLDIEIKKLVLSRVQFILIWMTRTHINEVAKGFSWIKSLSWPIEYLSIGFRPL